MRAALWRNHEATLRQQRLTFGAHSKRGRLTQADVLIAMLREARAQGKALELPEIMRAGIAQHGARFNEIRSRGFVIENELDHDASGVVRSWYWLRFDPERDGANGK